MSVLSDMYWILVLPVVQSSKHVVKPTVSPTAHPISAAQRAAEVIAARRRGWVTAILPDRQNSTSCKYCGICEPDGPSSICFGNVRVFEIIN